MLHDASPQVDVCAVDERDPIEGGPRGGHGPAVGHRGLRWDEESLHGERKNINSLLTLF